MIIPFDDDDHWFDECDCEHITGEPCGRYQPDLDGDCAECGHSALCHTEAALARRDDWVTSR